MSHPVLALGAAAVTAAGSVWYLPALADLRAGADRPASRRTGAVACLSGWTTAAAVAVLLLLTDNWWAPCAAAWRARPPRPVCGPARRSTADAAHAKRPASGRNWGGSGPPTVPAPPSSPLS